VPHIVEKLVEYGISSVSSNTDAIADVRKTVARAEQKIILDAARKRLE
jgi:pyruvate,water dikinase